MRSGSFNYSTNKKVMAGYRKQIAHRNFAIAGDGVGGRSCKNFPLIWISVMVR